MNKVVPTPTGFLLLVDQHTPPATADEIVRRLADLTGVTWVVLPSTEWVDPEDFRAKIKEIFEKTVFLT